MRWTIQNLLYAGITNLESILKSDILVYYGPMDQWFKRIFKELVEDLALEEKYKKMTIILTTTGGSVEATEDFVEILRHHYDVVDFIIPNYAMSAGTIFAMSGDEIYMDYASVLWPIDPQIQLQDWKWVPALWYLDKINELIEKEKSEPLTQSEINMIVYQDVGKLKFIEESKNLTVILLKKWLVNYKFKNWTTHLWSVNPHKIWKNVTLEEKEERAEMIARKLGNNQHWHTHGRSINRKKLWEELHLTTIDIWKNEDLNLTLKKYYDTLLVYIGENNVFFQTRNSF